MDLKERRGSFYLIDKTSQFIKAHTSFSVVIATLAFILFIIIASAYSNGLVWDYTTVNGKAVGMGTSVSIAGSLDHYDAVHYIHIAQYGYTSSSYTAFMPLYPLTIRAVHNVTHMSYVRAAFIISWVSLCGAAVVLYKWAELELRKRKLKVSPWVVLGLLALFPTSYYLAIPYTESLFMLLTLGALLAYRKERYITAGVLAALSSLERDQGIVLCLYFLADYYFMKKERDWKKLIPVVIGVLGIAAYMIFLKNRYGSFFEFLTAEKDWGRFSGNLAENLIGSFRPMYVWFVAVLVFGFWTIWKYLGKAYFLYSLIYILVPLASGRFISINRFSVSLLPMFLGLAIYGEDRAPRPTKSLYITTSAFLLAWSIMLFANGYWVA